MTYRVARESDHDRLGDILAHGFGFPVGDTKSWFERAGHENLRVLERHGALCGGLLTIPMGQFFGGRSVSTIGVAGVGIVPEARGQGVATELMLAMLRETRERGFALSTLYPATMTLYRRAGYERGCAQFTMRMDPNKIRIGRVRDVEIREVSGLSDSLKAMYASLVRNGYMDRGPYLWSRVETPRGLVTKTFTFERAGKLEGYVVVSHAQTQGFSTKVTVTDVGATSIEAANAILGLLCEYRSLAGTVTWKGDPGDLISAVFPERSLDIGIDEYAMVRIVDPARAFAMRGWPRSSRGSIAFELDDRSLPENSGTYGVTLADGSAHVERGAGPSKVRLNEHSLVSLYTGLMPVSTLVRSKLIEADDATMALLEDWFAGPIPVTRDFF
jgi:predicted acetyltransferase